LAALEQAQVGLPAAADARAVEIADALDDAALRHVERRASA
jgi:hypothetical protein